MKKMLVVEDVVEKAGVEEGWGDVREVEDVEALALQRPARGHQLRLF
jgi:hypothetical protein